MWVLPFPWWPSSDPWLILGSINPHLYHAGSHVLTQKHSLTCTAGYSVIFKVEEISNGDNPQGLWGFGFVDTDVKYNILSITKAS